MGSKNRPFLLLPWPCVMPTLPTCFFSPFNLSSPWGCRKVGWGVGEHSNLAEICFRRKGSVIRRVVSSDTSEPYKLKLLKPRWQVSSERPSNKFLSKDVASALDLGPP